MRKHLLILFIAATALVSSCKKDSETEILGDSYYPTTQGTTRTYKTSSGSSTTTYTETMSGKTSTFGGLVYQEGLLTQNNSSAISSSYYAENNGIYKFRGTTESYGITLEFEYLHANEPVGSSWIKNVSSSGTVNGVPARMIGHVTEKNMSKEVLGKSYKDVIHTTIELQYNLGSGYETSATYEYYSAKGIGLILVETNIDYYGARVTAKTELVSYTIK